MPNPPLPDHTSPSALPHTPPPKPLGYPRSASVTAAVDFFEQRARSTSASGTPASRPTPSRQSTGSPRGSPFSSPRPSISSEAGPSRTSSPRPRTTPRRSVSGRGRAVTSPMERKGSDGWRSGRTSVDSNASSTGRASNPPIGPGAMGMRNSSNGSKSSGEGMAGMGTTGRRVSGTGSKIPTPVRTRQSRPSEPANIVSPPPARPPPPSLARRQSTQTRNRVTSASSVKTLVDHTTPRAGTSSRIPSSTNVPASRATPEAHTPNTSPRSTLASSNVSTWSQASSSRGDIPDRPTRATQTPPALSVSQATPERMRTRVDIDSARPTQAGPASSTSSGSMQAGPGSKRTSYRLSTSASSHSSIQSIPSLHTTPGRESPVSRSDQASRQRGPEGEDEKQLPPLPSPSLSERHRPYPLSPPRIPTRISSAPHSPTSPTKLSPTMLSGPSPSALPPHTKPLISPRNSSMRSLPAFEAVGSPEARAFSDHLVPQDTIEEGRRLPKDARNRRSPGLSIVPPPFAMDCMVSIKPSPPIPAKSPLRRLSITDSVGRMSRVHSRTVSRDSVASSIGPDDYGSLAQISNPDPRDPASNASGYDPSLGQRGIFDVELTPQSTHSQVYDEHNRRLTMLTYASIYSQDSAPPTANWAGSLQEQQGDDRLEGGNRIRRRSRMDDLWGRSSRAGSVAQEDKTPLHQASLALRLSVPQIDFSQVQTESPISSAMNTATTMSDSSKHAVIGHSAGSDVSGNEVPPRPHRSPSAPMINGVPAPKAVKLLGMNNTDTRNRIPAPLLPSALTRSPTAPNLGSNASTPRTTSSAVSKRTHLIREIASTERAYATDLALIRDAYLGRYLRTNPGPSSASLTRSGSINSRSKRLSGTDWSSALPTPSLVSPLPRSPSEGPYGYFSSSHLAAAASTSSFKHSSPAEGSRSSLTIGVTGMTSVTSTSGISMAPPVGKPLAPSDVRTVFLNIDSLAKGAEEMAIGFENAVGEEETGPGFTGREGEGGTDRLGEVFIALLPRLRENYHYYCSRQQSASSRLQELLADHSTAAHLNDCWSQIKDQTHAWNLDSMLIKPVQRITKYPLLFEDLLACTTPVHPDYFNIRAAAELARSVAVEIDEAKRRKDVVANALFKKPKTPKSTLPSPAKDKKGLNIFRKEKLPPSLPTSVSSAALMSDIPPAEISKTSSALLRDQVARVEEADQVVKRVGKEVLIWTAATKDVLVNESGMIETWCSVVQLESQDPPPERLTAFRKVLDGLIRDVWPDLDEEVKERIMPIFSKLLDATTNPRRVIAKHSSKQSDYARYFALIRSRKTPERTLLVSAREFHALHTQLLDELPVFMEGYMRILDLALVAFSSAQARYFDAVRMRLGEFGRRWVARPRQSPSLTATPEAQEEADLNTGKGIVRAWHDAWGPYADAMDNFACTRPAKALASRMASFNSRPGSRTSSRVSSPAPGPSPAHTRPALQHSASFTSRNSSTASVSTASVNSRSRSHSLLGPAPTVPLPSPVKESRFNVFRSNSQYNSQSTSRTTPTLRSQPTPAPRAARPVSLHLPNGSAAEQRYSFGLPKIDQGFAGLGKIGLSPNARPGIPSPAPRVNSPASMRGVSESIKHVPEEEEEEDSPSIRQEKKLGDRPRGAEKRPTLLGGAQQSPEGASSSMNVGLGLGDVESSTRRPSATTSSNSGSRVSSSSAAAPSMSSSTSTSTLTSTSRPPSSYQMNGARSKDVSAKLTRAAPPPPSGREGMTRSISTPVVSVASYGSSGSGGGGGRSSIREGTGYEVDASEGWRNEPVLYQCGCVAEFDPHDVGDERYRGLRFLPMITGDLFDIFHEVGRIDELPRFPYPEVGVENDGVLVGRAESGAIGLLICSFLEPLRD